MYHGTLTKMLMYHGTLNGKCTLSAYFDNFLYTFIDIKIQKLFLL